MNPGETLQLFKALQLHFTSEYDYFKYKGQLKYKLDYEKRKDKFQIQKLSKHPDPQGLIIANLSVEPRMWSGDLISDKGLKRYKEWQKRLESLTYTFKEELKQLDPDLNKNLVCEDGQHPLAFRLFLGEHISLETLTILNIILNFYPSWNNKLQDDVVWQQTRMQLFKYQPFLNIEKNKFKELIQLQFSPDK